MGAHRFTVFFPATPETADETRRAVAAVVERERPAHSEAVLCPVYPRLRGGVQATVGVDSRVGGIGRLVLGRVATLNYDTVLTPPPAAGPPRSAAGATPGPLLGVSLKLP